MPDTANWTLTKDESGIAWLSLDKVDASANSLSRAVMEELDAQLDALHGAPPRALIITSAKKNGFVAGADIKEFIGIQSPEEACAMIRQGQQVLDRLESLPCTTVAAINGFALGGGLELALACKYRVVADDASITLGFPEVMLGVHPGLGGTVRAVRLAGPIAAMDLMLTGRTLRPKKALELGLVDRLAPPAQLAQVAKEVALNPPAQRTPGLKDRLSNLAFVRPVIAGQMRAQAAKRVRPDHYPAPYALIDLWQKHGGKGPQAYDAEARSMGRLLCTQTSRNLVRVFFLQERLKSAGKSGVEPAKHVHVVGAGVMGGDIAAWCAARGMTVTLQDRELKYIAPALERAKAFFDKRYPDATKREQAMARLKADVEGSGVPGADVVIEAIFENLEAKQELYSRLEPRMKPDAVLATNTSSIVLEQLSAKLADPARLIGLHFFNPVARMPLVEVIRARTSDAAVVQRGSAFARQIDKLAITCMSSPGFLVNRVLMPYLSEAIRAAEEGIPLALIDRAAEDFGMPMGPIELADVVGLDVVMSVGKVFFQSGQMAVPGVLQTRFDQKQFGKKTGQGFYTWVDDKPQKPAVSGQRAPADLQDRLLLSLVNEAVAVLREKVVEDADLVDAGVIFGAGFAPFRGGPLQYARERGVDAVVTRLRELQQVHGARFAPDPGWDAVR
ncbi:MAG TPA: 3-hydroxyacyl-CoA dehydrogenase NAD-binding domain-containing protein [Povalibacter sp.]|uniref:3-hydroxyacyl-CoA dehydrogenase NAD-binding domain-containing protein n=1 Tax=Povalibacter sp. TaxID=1962978 RepID=UPI002C936F2D|nr:3-hydroxyacyl-CoA dehydrogenase NAD-binding domain-containing protein [Povalibacter sp.]HMN43313.1 3-hydroxyacyl-CoA dehydrogenase NAD-binding domain-containing protein [Povalibacter sp.]